MVNSKTFSHFAFMQKPFNFLVDTVKYSRVYRGSFISRNVLLVGPAGCGKKTLIKKVASHCGALVVEISGTEISSPVNGQGRPGEVEANILYTFELIRTFCEQLNSCGIDKKYPNTSLKKVGSKSAKDALYSCQVVILLLTHIELMCPNRKQGIGCQTVQLLGAIDSLQHLDNLLIFATSSAVDDVDQAIRRPGRLDKEVYIGIPSEVERCEIIKELLLSGEEKGSVVTRDAEALARAAAALTPGRVLADLSLLCRQVKLMRMQRRNLVDGNWEDSPFQWLSDFSHCAAQFPTSSLLSGPGTLINIWQNNGTAPMSDCPPFSSIGGLQVVKERLVISVQEPLLHPQAFRRLGINPPRGVLLFGPPGCAKTTLARALASAPELSTTSTSHAISFISSSAAELYSPFVGESEKTVVDLFRRARAGAPSIVFIDELDALFGSRDGMHKGGVQERVLAALLMEMDGVGHPLVAPPLDDTDDQMVQYGEGQLIESQYVPMVGQHNILEPFSQVTVIAATNRPDLIDDALLRPGRFDQLIYIPPPDEEARFEILAHYTQGIPIECVDKAPLLRELAKGTDLYSGADIKNLCKEAALKAITEEGFGVTTVKKKHFITALKSMRSSLTPDMISSYGKIL